MKLKLLMTLTIFGLTQSAIALEPNFRPENSTQLACKIAREVKRSYSDLQYSELKKGINKKLDNEVTQFANAYMVNQPIIGTSNILFEPSDYFLQNAFVLYGNPDLHSEEEENWVSAFLQMANRENIHYLNGECPERFLSLIPDLKESISPFLDLVKDGKWVLTDTNGNNIEAKLHYKTVTMEDGSERISYRIKDMTIANEEHPQYASFEQNFMKMNQIVSPLFKWIISQPNESITPEELFNKANKIYEDPLVALGSITWLIMVDAHVGHRKRSSVVSYRLKPIVDGKDQPGYNYHFWGYMLHALMDEGLKYKTMAYVYENWIQDDPEDWLADKLGLKLGHQIKTFLKNERKFNSNCN